MNNEISINEYYTTPVNPEWEIYPCRYDLRHGDIMKSAKLVHALCNKQWQEAEDLLNDGADPRICRICDNVDIIPPLYLALLYEKYSLAGRLCEAGDRLDDFHIEGCKIPANVLMFIQNKMRWGINLFVDESKPLSDCAYTFQVARCSELIDSASAEELSLAAEAVSGQIRHGWEAHYWEILSMLKDHNADFTRAKPEMVRVIDAHKKYPTVMQLLPEYMTKFEDFIAKI